jgi:hypothetical protein
MDYIGIDLHKNSSQVCILTEGGELIERRIKTDRESFDKLFAERPPARILVEASTESEWAVRHSPHFAFLNLVNPFTGDSSEVLTSSPNADETNSLCSTSWVPPSRSHSQDESIAAHT